jgi:hypothetical protein
MLKKKKKILKIHCFWLFGPKKIKIFKNFLKFLCLKIPLKSNVYKCHKNSMFKNALKNKKYYFIYITGAKN